MDNSAKNLEMMRDCKDKFVKMSIYNGYKGYKEYVEEASVDDVCSDEFQEKYLREYFKKIMEIYANIPLYQNIYKNVLIHAKNNDGKIYTPVFSNDVNFDQYFRYFVEFLHFLGDDVYELFKKMTDKNLIVLSNKGFNDSFSGETAIYNDDYLSWIRVMHIDNKALMLQTLAHEMGHAYSFYLQKSKVGIVNHGFAVEFPSIAFEQFFISYLSHRYETDKKVISTLDDVTVLSYLLTINGAFAFNKYLANHDVEFEDANLQLKPAFDKESFAENSYLDIKNTNNRDCSYESYNMISNIYGMGYIGSCYFREKFEKNPEEAFKEFKDLLFRIPDMNCEEFLKNFQNQETYTANKNAIKKLVKKR